MNSIESNFVPYQIALDMKSIGFDEPCFGKFYYNQLEIGGNWCNDDFKEDPDIYISAPTFSQAFRWFRERYNFVGTILGDGFNGELKGYYYSITEEGWINYFESIDDEKWYNTYEEAELECLKKLIQIIKEKT